MEKKVIFCCKGRDSLQAFCSHYIGQPNANLSDERLLDVAASALLESGIANKPIRHAHGITYYFDDTGHYCADKNSEQFKDLLTITTKSGQRRAKLWDLSMALRTNVGAALNSQIWSKALPSFEEGSSLRDCLRKYMDTNFTSYKTHYTFVESMVTMVFNPDIERDPYNYKKNTFDRIRVTVGLRSTMFDTFQELRQAVIANRREIDEMVLEKISHSKHFKTYGIPVNALALSSLNLSRNYTLEYIFEPKQLTLDEKINSASARVSAHSSTKSKTNEKREGRE